MKFEKPSPQNAFEDEVLTRARRARDRVIVDWSILVSLSVVLYFGVILSGGVASGWMSTIVQIAIVGAAVFVVVRAVKHAQTAAGWRTRAKRARRGLCIWCCYPRAGLLSPDACPECGTEPRVENL